MIFRFDKFGFDINLKLSSISFLVYPEKTKIYPVGKKKFCSDGHFAVYLFRVAVISYLCTVFAINILTADC